MLSPVCAQRGGPYRLNAGDQIRMSVFQESNLLTEVQLIQGGEASFPLNGPVNLAGQTLREAESAVTALYNADYLVPVVRAEATPIAPVRRALEILDNFRRDPSLKGTGNSAHGFSHGFLTSERFPP